MKMRSAIRKFLGASMLALVMALAGLTGLPGLDGSGGKAFAQSGKSVRPPASAVLPTTIIPQPGASDRWRAIRYGVVGTVSIPDKKAGIMVQSEGEAWRVLTQGPLQSVGSWLLLLSVLAIIAYYLIRGRVRVESGLSGRTVQRFSDNERFGHWLSATTFIVLALTGLNLMYGRLVLLPILGPEAFSALTDFGKIAHNYLAFGFMIGLVIMFKNWAKDNMPDATDAVWLAQGGGLFGKKGVHPPAKKFNAGQKFIFWSVMVGGAILTVSGLILLFPFAVTDIYGMQTTQLIHAAVALILIAVMVGHIYIGSLGMQGAFGAVSSGNVEVNWAREHHSLWAKEAIGAEGKGKSGARG